MYLDLLLLVNLCMNFFVLSLVARLSHRTVGAWRLILAALGGSFPVMAITGQDTGSLIWWVLLLGTPVLMVGLAFYPVKKKDLFYLGGTVFGVAFLLGGVILCISNIRQVFPAGPGDFPWLLFPAVCLAGYLAIYLFQPYLHHKKWQKLLRASLQISLDGRVQTIEAFLDTGNRVKEPFLKKPVIIVDYRGLKEIFPAHIYKLLQESNLDPVKVLGSVDPRLASRFHLIPLAVLGGKREMLLGFRPDTVKVFTEECSFDVGSRVVLGLYQRNFGPLEDFQALMPPEVFHLVG